MECSFRCECTNAKRKIKYQNEKKKKGLVRGGMEVLKMKFSSPSAARSVNERLFSERVDLRMHAFICINMSMKMYIE